MNALVTDPWERVGTSLDVSRPQYLPQLMFAVLQQFDCYRMYCGLQSTPTSLLCLTPSGPGSQYLSLQIKTRMEEV